MKTSVLSAIHFHNEEDAYAYIEARLWPNGPVCPHCGATTRISKMKGKSTRIGLYKCYVCRKPFTVKIGTIFEDSHVPMFKWLQAFYLMGSSKKGISSNQLHRTLGVTLKTAWFMSHRIREAMRNGDLAPFGANGGIVESDETFIGKEPGVKKRPSYHHKQKVLSLIDRTSGHSRSFVIDAVNAKTIIPILQENINKEARLVTDDAGYYAKSELRGCFAAHGIVNHSDGEYVSRRYPEIHTNTVEGFFSVFKRGMKGVYQWCKKRHLHRYLAEFDFRYNNRCSRPKTKKRPARKGFTDIERADILLRGIVGRRLTYQTTNQGGIMN
ncbi:MAG: IS1595 family transposase [Desulfomonilaceae bacterium]